MLDNPQRDKLGIASFLVLVIAVYEWLVAGWLGPNRVVGTGVTLGCVVLCLEFNRRYSGDPASWGFDFRNFGSALRLTFLATVPAVSLIVFAGYLLGTLNQRDHPFQDLSVLFLWSLAQQFALQTVIYRSFRDSLEPRPAIIFSAVVFAALHLPNPFLTALTFIGGLVWCWIFARYPNLVPLALSQSLSSFSILCSFSRDITGGMRVGYSYLNTVF